MDKEVPPQDLEHLNKTYRLSRKLVRFFGGNVFGLHVSGLENIPEESGALLAANHRAELEVLAFPAAVNSRHVTMISKYELLEYPVLGKYLKKLGAIPIHREDPLKSEYAEIRRVLKEERLEASFPEGTRNKKRKKASEHADLGDFEPGFARIARRAGVLTVPAALYGMDRWNTNYRVVAFGLPMAPPADRSEEIEWTDVLKQKIEILYSAAHKRHLDVDRIRW